MTTMRSMRMMKARNGQTQDNRSPEDDGELGGRRQPVENARNLREMIINFRGRWDWPEMLRYLDRSGRGGGHRELPGSLRTVEDHDQHESGPI